MRDALRLLERDGLVRLVPNRGAIVPELRAVDVLEVYALRASLGTLALHKLMLDSEALDLAPLERELARLVRARSGGGRATPSKPTSRTRPASSPRRGCRGSQASSTGSPGRCGCSSARWTSTCSHLPRIVAEVQALHAAILARDVQAADRVWREKFERWISGLVGRLDEDFDDALWVALTRAASQRAT